MILANTNTSESFYWVNLVFVLMKMWFKGQLDVMFYIYSEFLFLWFLLQNVYLAAKSNIYYDYMYTNCTLKMHIRQVISYMIHYL